MKTICIETHIDGTIWGWIRLPSDRILYTILEDANNDVVRTMNLKRFNITTIPFPSEDYGEIIKSKDINIQICSNNWNLAIPWLYISPKNHPILSKSWLIDLMLQFPWLKKYIPKSIIVNGFLLSKEKIVTILHDVILSSFWKSARIVIKNAILDGNANWVWFLTYSTKDELMVKLQDIISKFLSKVWQNIWKVFESDYVIQEYITDKIWEWSISFSIQNQNIESWWLANNVVIDGAFFWSTNYYPYFSGKEWTIVENEIYDALLPLLIKLQWEWVRGNVWFDILYQRREWAIKPFILESNGICRTTWSTLPNCFCYNTKNDIFIWIPIIPKYLAKNYADLDNLALQNLASKFMSLGMKDWETQIMNIRSEWLQWWYPVLRIVAAWTHIQEVEQIYFDADFLNSAWNEYVRSIVTIMKNWS